MRVGDGAGWVCHFEAGTSPCFQRVLHWKPRPPYSRREALKEERRAVLNPKHNHPNKNRGARSYFILSLPG